MNAERMREIGRYMQTDADPVRQAAAEFVLDVAHNVEGYAECPEVIEHADTIAAAYSEDPGPVPEEGS